MSLDQGVEIGWPRRETGPIVEKETDPRVEKKNGPEVERESCPRVEKGTGPGVEKNLVAVQVGMADMLWTQLEKDSRITEIDPEAEIGLAAPINHSVKIDKAPAIDHKAETDLALSVGQGAKKGVG